MEIIDEREESLNNSLNLEPLKGDRPSMYFSSSQKSDQTEMCSAEHISDSDMDPEGAQVLFSVHSKQDVPGVQDTNENCNEISDHSVPCSQSSSSISVSSPVPALVPITNTSTPTQQLQEQTLTTETGLFSNDKEPNCSHSNYTGCQFLNHVHEEERGDNSSFTINQNSIYTAVIDEDSCDASYMQNVTDSANAFNEQYRVKRDMGDSFILADGFSPEAFFSSIPMLKKLSQKRPATILPKLNITDSSSYSQCEQSGQYYSITSHGLVMSHNKQNSALVLPSKGQGVPIAPKPDPNEKISCYVLVVPAPLYYENFAPQESLQVQQDKQEDFVSSVPSKPHLAITETGGTPEGRTPLLNPKPGHHPPQWTPQPQNPARTPLPSTILRVSPSPHEGSKSSPIITVSTTSTPIPPLQGSKQQYVIAQGNHRHLKGLDNYKDSYTTPTDEGNRQPIYLQGLPPQGFRRLLQSKEGFCTEKTTKRSLTPLFSKVSPSFGQEATVPQMEKSPLTCIKSKNQERNLLTNEKSDTPLTVAEKMGLQTTVNTVSECSDNARVEPSLDVTQGVETTTTPTSTVRRGEDKERKKIRDRQYDAELKKAFHGLRQVVPRLQKSSSRGKILQETIKYIGILEKKVIDAGLWPTLQSLEAQRNTQLESVTEETLGMEEASLGHNVPDVCSSLVVNTAEEVLTTRTEEECGENSQEETATVLASPVILIPPMSLPTEELSCSFMSPEGAIISVGSVDTNEEGVTVEEFPLPLSLQQIQFLTVDPSDKSPVLTPLSPDLPQTQEPHTRLIPVVEVPGLTDSSVNPGGPHEVEKSPHQDLILSAMTTISQDSLSDLGVTLSPLLSPLGILLSPGGDRCEESTIAVLVESTEGNDAIPRSGTEENDPASSNVMSSICSDMTSIAASVEVTTDQKGKKTIVSSSNTRKSPRSRSVQIVPSLSPQRADESKQSSPQSSNRQVLQDHSNLDEAKSPVIANGRRRRRKVKDHSPRQALDDTDENICLAANQSRTPPGRVSGVLLTGRRKTPSPRGGEGNKRLRRI